MNNFYFRFLIYQLSAVYYKVPAHAVITITHTDFSMKLFAL